MKKYVIIGNGTAAIGCVEGIRSIDANGSVTIVSEENHHVYCRPLISYYLENKTDPERMKYRPDDFYEKNNCNVLYGKKAVSISAEDKKIILDDGEKIDYDELCLATGSSPFVPPTDGLKNVEEKYTFMTLDDTFAIEKAVSEESHVLIVGAGLIGLKCAEGLKEKVKSITVCDLSERVLSSILDTESADIVQKHLEENGISFLLNDSVVHFDKNKAIMKSGKETEFDVLILAVGVRANVSLLSDIGGACTRGITVDCRMKTSLPNIYAAGDCTESVDVSDQTVKVMALMPNAYMQGHCAGVNMANGDEMFDNAIPMNSIGFFGLHIMTAGSRADDGDIYEERSDSGLKRLFIRDGRLVGFVLVGKTERAGIYTNLIRTQTPLDSIDFESLKRVPNLFAFNAEYRRKKLGGVV